MGTDRIAIIRGRADSSYDWVVYRRGQSSSLESGTIANITEPLPAGLDAKRAGATTIALPASQIVTRILTLPLRDKEELAGAVALQVDKFSPFPVEQMVYSYEILQQTEEETVVLVAMAQHVSVAEWGHALREAAVHIERVDCAALGAWHDLVKQGKLDAQRRQSFLLLDTDEAVLLTHDRGHLLSISGLGAPGDFADSSVCTDLSEEVARILMETDADYGIGEKAQLMVLAASAEDSLVALGEALAEATGIEVVQPDQYTFPDIAGGILQRSLAVSATQSGLLNLIPSEWVRDADSRRFRDKLMAIGGGLLALWLVLLGGGLGYLAWERATLEQLREREQQWLRPANAVRSMRLQVNLIDRYRDRTHSALEVLREVSSLLPEGIDLVSFTYRKGDGLEIIGEADSGRLVLQFNERLNGSELFRDVRPGTRAQTRQGRHRFSFDILFGEVGE